MTMQVLMEDEVPPREEIEAGAAGAKNSVLCPAGISVCRKLCNPWHFFTPTFPATPVPALQIHLLIN